MRRGRFVIEEPTDLPEGLVLDLVVDDEGDELTREERNRLHRVLSKRWNSAKAGNVLAAAQVIKKLRARDRR